MKTILYLSSFALILASCAGGDKDQTLESVLASKDPVLLNEKKLELSKEADKLAEDLAAINNELEELKDEKDYPLISTYQVSQLDFEHYIELQGDVETKQNIIIYPEYSGVLAQVYVKEGDRVKKNQLLAKIDDGGLSQQLAQLEIQFELAKTTFERQERLWDQKIGSEIQYLQAKAAYESQERAIEQLQNQLERAYVRAPFTGIIDNVFTEQGQVVNPGQNQLMRIVNLDHMYIKAEVPENYISTIKVGSTALVNFPSLGKSYESKIRQVGSFIHPGNRTFTIEIPISNKEKLIKPNLIANLSLKDYGNTNALVIPTEIVQEDATGNPYVYMIAKKPNSNIASLSQQYITTGFNYGGYTEVKEGLKFGDVIVSEGAKNMREGVTVSLKQ